MGADLSKAKRGTVIPASQALQQKERFAACEARIEAGLRSFADVGAALAEIRDSRLYLLAYGSFEEYVERRWELSRKRAYDTIANAAVCHKFVTKARPDLPVPALESHAAALAKVPEGRRAEVWAAVIGQTGGKPTARAVAEAWRALKDPHADLRGKAEPGKPSVSADQPVIGGNSAEDDKSAPVREPAGQVQESVQTCSVTDGTAETVTATTEPVKTATERKPHVCRGFACPECGKTDTAFSEKAGKLMDELEQARERISELEAEVADLKAGLEQAQLSGGSGGAELPALGNEPGWPGAAADGESSDGQAAVDADGYAIADVGEESQVLPDDDGAVILAFEDYGDAPAPDEGSQVPAARGRRRRG